MTICLDVYVLIHQREEETIEKFLDEYIDRNAQEDRGDEELMILPPDKFGQQDLKLEDFVWIPAKTLTNSIAKGLEHPSKCFALYFSSTRLDIHQVALKFTYDGKLVLGLSVDDWKQTEKNMELAEQLMDDLMNQFGGKKGMVVLEIPPPDSEAGFDGFLHNDRTFRFRQLEI